MIPNVNSTNSDTGYYLGGPKSQWNTLYTRGAVFGNEDGAASNVRPFTDNTGSLGTDGARWGHIYGVNGHFDTLIPLDKDNDNDTETNLGSTSKIWTNAYINNIGNSDHPVQKIYVDNLLPADGSDSDTEANLGSASAPWTNAYITNLGSADKPVTSAYITTGKFDTINIKMGNSYTDLSTYINNAVTYDDNKVLTVTNKADGITGSSNNGATLPSGTITGNTAASINTTGGIYAA